MKSYRVILLVGAVYRHRNGYTYRCIDRKDGGYVMQSPAGWISTVHGVWQQEDGLIWWDYSTKGHFGKAQTGNRGEDENELERTNSLAEGAAPTTPN